MEEVTPRFHALVEDVGFDDLIENGTSTILLANRMQNTWPHKQRICPMQFWQST